MADTITVDQDQQINQAVADGGAYEVIRKRLEVQGEQLNKLTQVLNEARLAEFGESTLGVIGRVRLRTENNCLARDIARIGSHLLFGYNVFIGLKTETKINDVFGLYDLVETDEGYDIQPVEMAGTFLDDARFKKEFQDLYGYYKDTKLLKLTVANNYLLATFQISKNATDIRVFRWSINQGVITYIDDRGERDVPNPPKYDFEWKEVTRENHTPGKHPHVSVEDLVFVDAVHGTLTVKVENNTEDGLGIYSEPVVDQNQSLADARIYYSHLGPIILLKILPYRETAWRYLVFNTLNNQVNRIDAIGQTCIQLPEDHGLIFPGGYYLQSGETKLFGDDSRGMQYEQMIKSTNGEDVLYVFYEPTVGRLGLFTYNLIRKTLATPLYGHGFTLFEDGKALLFSKETDEASRNHAMQIWQTPFVSSEHVSKQPPSQSYYGRIGNADMVRAISELYSVVRAIGKQDVSTIHYENLKKSCGRLFDVYYWLENSEVKEIGDTVRVIQKTSNLVLDEFAKVESIRKQANLAIATADNTQQQLFSDLRKLHFNRPEDYIEALDRIRHQRGHLVTIGDLRYIDTDRIGTLDQQLESELNKYSQNAVDFLQKEDAFSDYRKQIDAIQTSLPVIATAIELKTLRENLERMGNGLDLLTEVISTLKVADATVRTKIIELISDVYARLNQTKAKSEHRSKELGSKEAVAEFGAQFTLFTQSITNALTLSTTPEKCDEQLTRLVAQLEGLESQFSEYDEFLADIMNKREEMYESFESKKQALLDERQRRIHNLSNAADRILEGITRKVERFQSQDEINTYFSSDAMVAKCRDLIKEVRELGDSVKADDYSGRLKSAKDQAVRSQRDKQDIFEDDGNIIKMGRHRFSVNTKAVDITIVPRDEGLAIHLSGTDYFEKLEDDRLLALQKYWQQPYISESASVYRAEYLAASILNSAEQNKAGLDSKQLHMARSSDEALLKILRTFMESRYQEGYEKGIHDFDAAKILSVLITMREHAGLLRYPPAARALAIVFWTAVHNRQVMAKDYVWPLRAKSAQALASAFGTRAAFLQIQSEIRQVMAEFYAEFTLQVAQRDIDLAAEYLSQELASNETIFSISRYGKELADGMQAHLIKVGHAQTYQTALAELDGSIDKQWSLIESWLNGYVTFNKLEDLRRFIPEAIAITLVSDSIRLDMKAVEIQQSISGLMGSHARITEQAMDLTLDDFIDRLHQHETVAIPEYKEFLELRQTAIKRERNNLRLNDFKARPLTSFVRNLLINDVYLPIIGDNLAKQMGTVGENKRTDLMGLLLLISPPGYGKTTLMEYVANRMGLIFMKINCPSLGHDVRSLDPQQAPNATARQELQKINLGFEMGNNVMLYLDDIQHTHPEFLQKFISLCDGTRRIDGVWKNQTKTYDLRGKKFCVVMAGNPYTESGDTFKIPDMLANRADIYNLGDVLSGREKQFSLSYIENCLTSNSVLAPLATRDMRDIYTLIRKAQGEEVANTDLVHSYSSAEVNEIVEVLKKLFLIQSVVLKVNQQYILSAAQDDKYRIEPPFKLQGSYRNMNKMAEKINSVMNQQELNNLIRDHYIGEAQTLTTGAEENLLKLGELTGSLSEDEKLRWSKIRQEYARIKSMGGDETDSIAKLVNQVSSINTHLSNIQDTLKLGNSESTPITAVKDELKGIAELLKKAQLNVEVINQPVPGMDKVLSAMADAINVTLLPVVSAMDHKLRMDHDIWDRVKSLADQISNLEKAIIKTTKQTRPIIKNPKGDSNA